MKKTIQRLTILILGFIANPLLSQTDYRVVQPDNVTREITCGETEDCTKKGLVSEPQKVHNFREDCTFEAFFA
jgi:hypothetical protein